MASTKLEEKKDDSPPPIPVDRQWLVKLLQKYPNPHSRQPQLDDDNNNNAMKALVVAPMVDQSDLPFRLLCRRYGANLCFTPMIHTRLVVESPTYQQKFFSPRHWPTQDRPLIAQMYGSDPDIFLRAAQLVEPHVDGIDINCGCPQGIARRGNYGAFLLEQEEALLRLVKHLVKHLRVPLSVKVRLLPRPDACNHPSTMGDFDIPTASLELYEKLVDAGVHMLTIHGRTRKQKAELMGQADWDTIGKAVELYGDRIPILANGSIQDFHDVEECLRITKADGIMSSESLLEYPPIFYHIHQTPERTVGRIQIAREYLELAKQYPPNQGGQGSGLKCIRAHIHKFLHKDMADDPYIREQVVCANSLEDFDACIDLIEQKHLQEGHCVADEKLSWYRRHRDGAPKPKFPPQLQKEDEEEEDPLEEDDGVDLFCADGCNDGDYWFRPL